MSEEKKEITAEEKAKAAAAAKAKAAAAAKAKAAAAAKAKAAAEQAGEATEAVAESTPAPPAVESSASGEQNLADEKAKAAAAAKAKAAAAAKAKAAAAAKAQAQAQAEAGEEAGDDEEAKAKAKAAAAAKAKAAAAARAKAKAAGAATEASAGVTDDEKAKAIAIAKAKAAAAAKARAAKAGQAEEEEKPKEPSVNQPLLDKFVKVITENMGSDVIEESYINEKAKDVPTLVINKERWYEAAQFLKHNEQLAFDYLSCMHGVDFETHMETYYQLYSFKERHKVAIRVKTDREQAEVASVTPLWEGANWPERETYDLLGITFTGHPNMVRILLPDDWVGYPLRKDYEQHDEEV